MIWLLLAATLGLFPLQSASGATLTWNRADSREELVFKFDSPLPVAEPRQRGLTRIQLPIPLDFWKNEAKPVIPNFSTSVLVKSVQITEDGVMIETRSGDFIFSSSTFPELHELNIEFYPPPQEPPAAENMPVNATNATVPEEVAETAGNDTEPASPAQTEKAVSPRESAEHLSGTASVRGKIARPGGEPPRSDIVADAPGRHDFKVRMPIDRNATAPLPQPTEADRAEAVSTARAGEVEDNATAVPKPEIPDAATNVTSQESAPPSDRANASALTLGELVITDAPQAAESRVEQTGHAASVQPEANATVAEGPQESLNATAANNDFSEANASAQTEISAETNASAEMPPPADNSTAELEELYKQAQTAMAAGDLEGGRQAMTAMVEHPKAPEALREELLYNLADITMQQGKDDLEGNFTAILEAYEAAKYANPASRNVPEALYRIGYLHLSVGNLPEAKGNFDLLRRKYPDNPRVPMTDVFWGDHYLREKQYAKAAEHYRYVLQNFPMSAAVKPANVGLLKAYTELGFFDKAMEIVKDIEKRWPRYYLGDPSFLMAAGYAAMLSGNNERAREYFWAYANIVPEAPDADVAMARIGDIHLKQNKPNAAREIYHRTAEAYPDREGGLIAQMRLAEEGVLDKPSIGDMAPVFDRPEINPEEIYKRILEHTESPLAPVARLKLAMWRLWNKKFPESLEDVRRFQQDYPNHELLPKAREVADKAMQDWILRDLEQENFPAIVQNWQDNQDLFEGREPNPETRLVVATAFMRTGQSREALDMARPFVFGSIPRGQYSEQGMDLTLTMLVDLQQWKDVLELARLVEPWNLGAERKRQVDYAAALAHEKLDQPALAKPLWTRLATDLALTDTQRGYAHYFLGRAALAAGELEQASILGQEALELLKKEKDDIPKLKETLELLVQAADRGGRPQEALAWSLEYDDYISSEDRGWPAHTYRKAILFRKNEDMTRWRETLNRLKELFPNSLYGRMAAAELEGVRLKGEVEKFR